MSVPCVNLLENNPFKIFGLDSDASKEEITHRYKKLARIFHPDKNSSKTANEEFVHIQNAYEQLLSGNFNFFQPEFPSDSPFANCPFNFPQSFTSAMAEIDREKKERIQLTKKIEELYPGMKITKKNLKIEIKKLNKKQRVCDLHLEALMKVLVELKNST